MRLLVLLLVVKLASHEVSGKASDPDDLHIESDATTDSSNDTEPITDAADDEAVNLAVRDVAFYLRAHKFNEFDRRYFRSEKEASAPFFAAFPDPPLRSLHWEVRKNCENGFLDCLRYLHEKVSLTDLRRADDTSTIAREMNWTLPNNSKDISASDKECLRLRKLDLAGAQPFQGPLERFQWRTTASYYMCWFTMTQVPALTLFGEPCDNFANCLDAKFGFSNQDPRADDRLPFQCALYSFCPETCCPKRHVTSLSECWVLPLNPCRMEAPKDERQCSFKAASNRDFRAITLGMWNASCACRKAGYEWDSRYGMCVDVDECARKTDTCNHTSEACFNLPGYFACGCRWGFLYDFQQEECARAVDLLIPEEKHEEVTEKMSPSIIKAVANKLFPASSAVDNSCSALVNCVIGFIVIRILFKQLELQAENL